MNEETINNNYTPTKKEQKLAIFITIFTIVMITGLTYTFFSAAISNTNNEKLTTQTATMSLEFDDNDNGISANLNLGDSITKKFTLQNTGTVDAYGKINWYNLVNTYTPDSLTWTLEQSESENGSYIMVGLGKVPVSSEASNKLLKGSLFVPVNKTYYYKLTITLNNLNIDQSSDINANMHSQFSLSSAVETGVDKITNIVANHPVNTTKVIDKTEYEYEQTDGYVYNFNGFIWPTEWEYDTIEDCESEISWLEEEFGSDVEFVCQLDSNTELYNILANGAANNPSDTNYIFDSKDDCEDNLSYDDLKNVTCVNKQIPFAECTNTLAYDGTSDNNLRYVGANPCNYVTFNDEPLRIETRYRIIDKYTNADAWGEGFTTFEACNEARTSNFGSSLDAECLAIQEPVNGWRILGIMNNVDDGTGNLETRIKLMRAASLGDYSWDTSDSSVNRGYGINDWTQADLMNELNGDYLNTNLSTNTIWYDGYNNQKTAEYDYTKGLSSSAQSLIGNAKWHLGGLSVMSRYDKVLDFYGYERGTIVYSGRPTQWIGKVALMYPSDFGFAVGGETRNTCLEKGMYYLCSDNCCNYNWLNIHNIFQPFLSPSIDEPYWVFSIVDNNDEGYFCTYNIDQAGITRPVVYLKSNVKISGGNGSISNPYIIE